MPKIELGLANLAQVKGGLVEAMLGKALARAAADIESAPDILDARKVVLAMKCTPVLDRGELEDVAVEFEVGSSSPKRCTTARMQVKSRPDHPHQRGLFFEVDAPDNPHQASLLDQADDLDGLVAELHRTGQHKLAGKVEQLAGLEDEREQAVEDALARSRARQEADQADEGPRNDVPDLTGSETPDDDDGPIVI